MTLSFDPSPRLVFKTHEAQDDAEITPDYHLVQE